MPSPPRLQRFVDDELSRSRAMAEQAVRDTLAQLQQPRAGMLGLAERQHYHELLQRLPQRAAAFTRSFDEALQRFVRAELEETGNTGATGGSRGGLELMDETRIEADIEISRAAQLIDGAAEWELRELNTFTSALAGQKHVTAESNPFRPLVHARALWEAVGAVTTVPVQRAILMQTAAGVLSGQLKKAWAAACSRLEEKGIEPSIYRTVVLPAAGAPRAPIVDVTRPGALEDLLPSMPVRQPLPPAATGRPADPQVVELLSRLFEAVLADAQLPAAFRAPIVRLQVSALRVALADPGMLHAHDHPVWQLVNGIADAAEGAGAADGERARALLGFCETLVDEIARAPVQDAQGYRRGLTRLHAFLAEQLRLAQAEAAEAVDALTHAERRDALERVLSARLAEQMAPIRASAAIRRFVTGAWARGLAEAVLRHGDTQEPTLGFLQATDELLWSLHLPDHAHSRQRLVALLPALLQRLREGMALAGLPAEQQDAVLDELMAVHTEALRTGRPGGDEPTPQQIMQRLRDETLADTGSPAAQHESLIDVSSMETVPADAMASGPAAADPARRIDALQPGSRCRLFVNSGWTQALLLWRSPQGGYFVFAAHEAGRRISITRRALERLGEEGLLQTPDGPSLLQRAVDRLVRRLV